MDAQHSSQPPASARPATRRPRRRPTPSGRKPGGPPGHQGQTRALVPREDVEAVRPVTPTHCARCQPPGHGEDGQAQRHQVPALPPVPPVVTASPGHRLGCPACGATTRAARPLGGPTGGCGPRVHAPVARCTGASHLSQRTPQAVRADRCGIPLRLGTLATLAPATGAAVAAPGTAAQPSVRAPSRAHLDETGGRAGRTRAWVWVAVTAWVTVCVGRLARGAKVAEELWGERGGGLLGPDRGRASPWYPTRWRHVCWAHLRRAFAAMRARGAAWRAQTRPRCPWWPQVRDGPLTHAQVRVLLRPMRRQVARRRQAGQPCGGANPEGGWRARRTVSDALWTCGRVAGVEPTNKTAERALRPGVVWRKGRCGTQRAAGSRLVEAMMTVVATRTQPHRPVRASMTDVCQAIHTGAPAPSLLPVHPERHAQLPAAA